MSRTFTTSRTAVVTLGGEEYTVDYEIEGECWFDPGQVSGPPESCYPPDYGSEVSRVNVLKVYSDDREMQLDAALTDRIKLELNKLDLDQFLYDAWGARGSDDEGPDFDDDSDEE